MSTSTPLFPPYLNCQTPDGKKRSYGAAVAMLQQLLNGWSRYPVFSPAFDPIEVTGVYDDATEARVRQFQEQIGFTGADVDGNFGPGTRARVLEYFSFDCSRVLVNSYSDSSTSWVDQDGNVHLWPPA